jgi:LPS sulfotransferase NodH
MPPSVSSTPEEVLRPIFVVGAPRSGTSLLHQLLRLHPALAWITPVSNRCLAHRSVGPRGSYPVETPATAPFIEAVVRRLPRRLTPPRWRGPHDGSLGAKDLPETSEGYQIWRGFCPEAPHHRLTEADVTAEAAGYFRGVARWHARRFGRPRFLGKRPRHVLRLRYLRAVFPEAQFVHLVRDGRAVSASMLRRRRGARGEQAWWGLKPPGWRRVQGRPPVVQCGWTWKRCCQIARDDAEATGLMPDQYHRVRYETLTARPVPTLNGLIEALGLSSPETFQRALRPHLSALENRNDRWPARLSATQQEALLNEIGEALKREGYGAG